MLTDVDLKLRSANQHAPAMALVERTMVRLAMVAPR
jgi:DNA polymerase-3 subunit delta